MEGAMFSSEMQIILGAALVVLSIAVIWALWRRTARQSVTTLLLTIGTVLMLAGSGPVLWWQISSRSQSASLQPAALNDHRVAEPTVRETDGRRRLEIDIELILSRLPEERLEEIARTELQKRLTSKRFDLAVVRLRDPGARSPKLYLFAHKKEIDPEQIRSWLQPDASESVTGAQWAPVKEGELASYRTITFALRASSKWARLTHLLNPATLPLAVGALDEAFYDYITVEDGERVSIVLIFIMLNEESLRQYQGAGGHPEELGLVGAALPVPSVLVIVHAMSEGLFHLGELSLAQSQGGEVRRVALRDLALGEELLRRAPWTRLKGNFPQFPNLLAHLRSREQLIGLLRLPREFNPHHGFQLYYGSRWAGLLQK
jgi:hypothetical protein